MREGDPRYLAASRLEVKVNVETELLRNAEREYRRQKLVVAERKLVVDKLEQEIRENLESEFYTLEEACRVTGLERRKLTNRLTYGRIFGMKILGMWWVEKETADSYIKED